MLLRSAVPDDALPVARVHVRSWQVGYRNLMPAEYLDGLRPEDWVGRYEFGAEPGKPETLVAVEDGAILGFATVAPLRHAAARGTGEIWALYVDPPWWGRDIGRALIEGARNRLRAAGFREAVLWVLAGNTRAQRFYRRDGWLDDNARRTRTVRGLTVDEIRYRRPLASP